MMQIRMSFLGAAQNVTGSRYLVEVDHSRVLVDCGLYQERQFLDRNWDPFPVAPRQIDAVVLTHAHLDHCGLLPKLVKEGFRGKVYCTSATAELARIILLDSAELQEEDAAYKQKRHRKERRLSPRPIVPLYTVADAERCRSIFRSCPYGEPIEVARNITATFRDSGHVLGSATIHLDVKRDGDTRSILFSGDVGRNDMPIIEDPSVPDQADYLLIESTYGDRDHEPAQNVGDRLADVVNRARAAGGNLVIPCFALERAQVLLYLLNELLAAGKTEQTPVFLDSPMAVSITKVFEKHPELYDAEMSGWVERHQSPFRMPGLRMVQTVEESKRINRFAEPCIILAGSGMCTGGRIKHHLANNIERPESTILFVGYQSRGTLGRVIADGAGEVRIHGVQRQVRAKIERIHGLSAHADRNELAAWVSGMARPPRRVFVVHGEAEAAEAFGRFLHDRTGWRVSAPAYGEQAILNGEE
jgi:metallo-beta-lactamase family protein